MDERQLSRVDVSHIQKMVFDEETWSYRVKVENTEIEIETDNAVISAIGVTDADTIIIPEQKCHTMKAINLYVEVIEQKNNLNIGNICIEVSPIDNGDLWYKVQKMSISENCSSGIIHILARRIRVVKDSTLECEINVHLNMQG